MNDYQIDKILVMIGLGLLFFLYITRPRVAIDGDMNRLNTLPVAISIGNGGATNSILQATDSICPDCGAVIP